MSDVASHGLTRLEPAPGPRLGGRPGPLAADDGAAVHGCVVTVGADGSGELVVANHGHVVARRRVPDHRWRSDGGMLRVANALVALPWCWDDRARGRPLVAQPPDTAIGRVVAGRKPAAQASTTDRARARRWVQAAEAAGLAAWHHRVRVECPPDAPAQHLVSVARREPFAALVDLDAVLGDLAAAGITDGRLVAAATEAALLESHPVAEVAAADARGRTGDDADGVQEWLLARGTAGDLRVGLALGHHPALIAARLLGWADWSGPHAGRAGLLTCDPAARTAALPGLRAFGGPRRLDRAVPTWGGSA